MWSVRLSIWSTGYTDSSRALAKNTENFRAPISLSITAKVPPCAPRAGDKDPSQVRHKDPRDWDKGGPKLSQNALDSFNDCSLQSGLPDPLRDYFKAAASGSATRYPVAGTELQQ